MFVIHSACAAVTLLAVLVGAQQFPPRKVCLTAVGGSLDPEKGIHYKTTKIYVLGPFERDLTVEYGAKECTTGVGSEVRGLKVSLCDYAVPTVDTSTSDPTNKAYVQRNGDAQATVKVFVDLYCGPVYYPDG